MRRIRLYVLLVVVGLAPAGFLLLRSKTDRPHSVTLTWQAPAVRGGVVVAGYNIYRRTSDGGPFVKIAERVVGPPYEDRLVAGGRKYIYAVTTLDQTGRESRFSSEASAEIP